LSGSTCFTNATGNACAADQTVGTDSGRQAVLTVESATTCLTGCAIDRVGGAANAIGAVITSIDSVGTV
jgi:hypothetical protein